MTSIIKVDNIQDQDGNNIINENSNTITIGASGDTVTIPSGATISNLGTAAGFGSTGEVSWNTTKVTTGFTATSGVGYFADTSSSAFTITLPSSPSAGNVVAISDYSGNFGTNGITVGRNSSNINGAASDFSLDKDNTTAQFIYVDGTQGWRVVFTGSQTGDGLSEGFITATGGTITTSGNCKIHKFTGPGTFCVSAVACTSANNQVSYMVVAGGGGGGHYAGAGGGGGGFREDKSPVTPYTASPLEGAGAITVTAQGYPITVGGGGATSPAAGTPSSNQGTAGSNSVFSTITSAGGGGGGGGTSTSPGGNGGSGGGGARYSSGGPGSGGTGNTPPVSPAQGTNGAASCGSNGGGGGGATAAGAGKVGGAGATTNITASPEAFAGGGGAYNGGGGGTGGGGEYNPNGTVNGGAVNTGGGASGDSTSSGGGSGIVVIRYKFQ